MSDVPNVRLTSASKRANGQAEFSWRARKPDCQRWAALAPADPTRRRVVVAAASYEARAFGIRSGMPLRAAAKRCPDAVFLQSDPAAYDAASARVMATLRSFPVVVEVWGWDEAFVGARTPSTSRWRRWLPLSPPSRRAPDGSSHGSR